MVITKETLAELSPYVRQEIERVRREEQENRTAWKRVKKKVGERLAAFNYVDISHIVSVVGEEYFRENAVSYAYKLFMAFSAQLRAVYRVNQADKIPASEEKEIEAFMHDVLDLMEKLRSGAKERGVIIRGD